MTSTSHSTDARHPPVDAGGGERPGAAVGERALARSQLGMYVFLASDLMLFAPFFAAYFMLRTNSSEWPPADVDLDVPRALIATLVLVSSSGTLLLADRAAEAGDLRRMRRWLIATVLLGAAFLANQLAEYTTLPFGPDDHAYGSIYWLLTGLHTCHVTVGLLVLLAVFARTYRVRDSEQLATWTAGGSAFWHLIDIVWIGVFVTIWVIQ